MNGTIGVGQVGHSYSPILFSCYPDCWGNRHSGAWREAFVSCPPFIRVKALLHPIGVWLSFPVECAHD